MLASPLILGADVTSCLDDACPDVPLSKLLDGPSALITPSKINAVYLALQADLQTLTNVLALKEATMGTILADAFKPELAVSASIGKAETIACLGAKALTEGGAGC